MKTALITGITGQDGSYLAEFLLEKGYDVHGLIRRSSISKTDRINHIIDSITLHNGDLTDQSSIMSVVQKIKPDEIYNLGAQSHVKISFDTPEYSAQVDALGALRVLEAVRILGLEKSTKVYQASTSELYGLVQETPQSERTPFHPRSPYGVAKIYGFWIVKNYREAYNMYACTGILFNHESPRRGEDFVTRKIVLGLDSIRKQQSDCLYLGNLNALRDWGHAKDFVTAMWLMLQQNEPEDFVIATGIQHSVKEFAEKCAPYFGMNIIWQGEGYNEIGIDTISNKTVIRVDSKYFRPSEVNSLLGDSTLAKNKLGWKQQYSFDDLVEEMCQYQLTGRIV